MEERGVLCLQEEWLAWEWEWEREMRDGGEMGGRERDG